MGDTGMFGEIEGYLFWIIGHVDFVGKDLPVLTQGYCVHLATWVNLDSHDLHPVLCGEQQSGVEGSLSI